MPAEGESLTTAPEEPFANTLASPLAATRLLIGLGQGVLLWALFDAVERHSWPSTDLDIFAPALLIALFVPIVAVTTLGSLRPLTLVAWLAVAAMFLGALGLHEVARGSIAIHQAAGHAASPGNLDARVQIFVLGAVLLFIAQALVVAGDAERRLIAVYPTYFDIAWKQEVQLLLGLLFLGLFWGVLGLGAALFHLIGIDFLKNLIGRSSFAMPASTAAFACALHLTDIRARLVQGMRNLLHMLLSWLLPLAVVLIIAFIFSLPFTGLTALWRTSHGSEIVLATAAVLVVLINTAYRDGEIAGLPVVLRWSGTAATACLPILVAISAYGLALRIAQRGWTETRIVAVACAAIGGLYALGYFWAAIARGPWLKFLEATNIATAGAIVVVIAVLTTIADPARLAVSDQVARLESGRISPSEFDFKYLRFDAARYGRDALERLRNASGPNAEPIRQHAEEALQLPSRYAAQPPSQAQLAKIAVFPAGQALPQSFLQRHWADQPQHYSLPECLFNAAKSCEAFMVPAPDGRQQIIVAGMKTYEHAVVFALSDAGTWQPIGSLPTGISCETVRQALRQGSYRWVAPPQMDLEAETLHLPVTPWPSITLECH